MHVKSIPLLLSLYTTPLVASSVQTYQGTAKDAAGKPVYVEKHKVTFGQDGQVIKADTEYVDANGKALGRISSDFTTKLTAPAHSFTDARTGEIHGIRYDGDKIVLFVQEAGQKERTKTLSSGIAENGIIVGCQGLHYYLRKNFDDVLRRKEIPVKMLIPGRLDYYSFVMKYKGERNEIVEFEVEIDSFFLRMFTPSLKITYDRKTRHLLTYEGLSNIVDSNGDLQNVKITYDYSHGNG